MSTARTSAGTARAAGRDQWIADAGRAVLLTGDAFLKTCTSSLGVASGARSRRRGSGRRKVHEAGEVPVEADRDGVGRAVAVLGDDEVRLAGEIGRAHV